MTIFTRARRCFTSGQRYFDKFRRAKILFLDEGTREWLARKHETRAVIKRVNSINSNASFSMMVMVSKRVETEKNEKTTTISRSDVFTIGATKATWKVYVHMHARSSNCQLNDAKHMDYFVATTLFRDAPRSFRRFEAFAGLGTLEIPARSSWHGKNHYSPRVVTEVFGWEKCQCLFDPYNLSLTVLSN